MNEKLLQDYVATANNPEYGGNWEIINSKFPELKGVNPQLLMDYVATANNPKYGGDWKTINSKFPEFNLSGEPLKKKESSESPSGLENGNYSLDSNPSETPTQTTTLETAPVQNTEPEGYGTTANPIQLDEAELVYDESLGMMIGGKSKNQNMSVLELRAHQQNVKREKDIYDKEVASINNVSFFDFGDEQQLDRRIKSYMIESGKGNDVFNEEVVQREKEQYIGRIAILQTTKEKKLYGYDVDKDPSLNVFNRELLEGLDSTGQTINPEHSNIIRSMRDAGVTDDQLSNIDLTDFAKYLNDNGYETKYMRKSFIGQDRMVDEESEQVALLSHYTQYKLENDLRDMSILSARSRNPNLTDEERGAIADEYNSLRDNYIKTRETFTEETIPKFEEYAKEVSEKKQRAEDYQKAINTTWGDRTASQWGTLWGTTAANSFNKVKQIPYDLATGFTSLVGSIEDALNSENLNPNSPEFNRSARGQLINDFSDYLADYTSKNFSIDAYEQNHFAGKTTIYEDAAGNKFTKRPDGYLYDSENNVVTIDESKLTKLEDSREYDFFALGSLATEQAALMATAFSTGGTMGVPVVYSAVSYKDNLDTYRQAFPDASPTESLAYATALSGVEGLSHLILPENKLFNTHISSKLLNALKGLDSKSRSEAARDGFAGLMNVILKENLEEWIPEVNRMTTNIVANSANGTKKLDEEITMETMIDITALTTLVSGIAGVRQQASQAQASMGLMSYDDAIYRLAQRPHVAHSMLESFKNKEIAESLGQERIEQIKLDLHNTILDTQKLPKGTTKEQYDRVKPLLQEKEELREEMKKADDAFKKHYQTLIEGINEDITKAYNQPKVEEEKSETVSTDPDVKIETTDEEETRPVYDSYVDTDGKIKRVNEKTQTKVTGNNQVTKTEGGETQGQTSETENKVSTGGKSTQEFFGTVVQGGDERYTPSKPYEYEEEFEGDKKSFQENYDSKKGNFDDHIATSIPTFRETQVKKGTAVVKLLEGEEAPVVYDIGGSEGSWVKTVTEESGGNIKTINLDPNPEMRKSFEEGKPENSDMVSEAFHEGWDDVPAHKPAEKADVVHESMTFQFIDNGGKRDHYIQEVKENYLKEGGVFITEEKFKMNTDEEYTTNEKLKESHKNKYYTPEQQSLKSDEVLVGMKKNQASFDQYLEDLRNNFKYVEVYWSSGNFRGIVATDSKEKLDKFLEEVGDTSNDYTAVEGEYNRADVSETTDAKDFVAKQHEAIGKRTTDSLQVELLTEEQAQEILDEGGKLFLTSDGKAGAYVRADGYMGGLFKDPTVGKTKAAKVLQEARVKAGGKFFDAFGTHLEDIYIKNGFVPVARMTFNEEYAPEGWEKTNLKDKPDNVFFVYDPNSQAKKGDGERIEDYDTAYEKAKNHKPTAEESVKDINKIDLSNDLGVNKAIKILTKARNDIDKFGRENLSSIIVPTQILTGAIDAMIVAAKTAKLTADITSAGLNYITNTEWYKGLKKSDKDAFHKKGLLNIISEQEEQIRKSAKNKTSYTKKKIRELTGQTDTSKKVITTEAKALKEQIKNFARGIKEGHKDATTLRKEFTDYIKEVIEDLKKGRTPEGNNLITDHEVGRLLSKVASAAPSNIEKVTAEVERLIDKVEERQRKRKFGSRLPKLQKRARKKAKTTYGNAGRNVVPLTRIDVSAIPERLLQEYYDVMESLALNKNVDFERVNTLFEDMSDIIDRHVDEKYNDKLNSVKEEDTTEREKSLAVLEDNLRNLTIPSDSTITREEKRILNKLKAIPMSYFESLSKKEIDAINKALIRLSDNNYMQNKVIANAVLKHDAKVVSDEIVNKVADKILKPAGGLIDFIDRLRGKDFRSERFLKSISNMMLHHVDSAVKGIQGTTFYETILHPLTSNLDKAEKNARITEMSLTKLINAAEKKSGKKNSEYAFELAVRFQLFFRAREFDLNPKLRGKEVFGLSLHMDAFRENAKQLSTNKRTQERVLEIYDEMVERMTNEETNELDSEKLYNSFTAEEREIIKFMDEQLIKSKEAGSHVNNHLRAQTLIYPEGYFPRRAENTESNEEVDIKSMVTGMLGSSSVKADASNIRVAKKAHALNFDTFGNFMNHVRESNIEQGLAEPIKKIGMTLSNLQTNENSESVIQFAKGLEKGVQNLIELNLGRSNYTPTSKTSVIYKTIVRRTFNKVLIDPIRLLGYDLPSNFLPVYLSNIDRIPAIIKANKALKSDVVSLIEENHSSTQAERIAGSRSIDHKDSATSTIGKSKFKKYKPSRIEKFVDLMTKNKMSDFGDYSSVMYYRLADAPAQQMWKFYLMDEYSKITGEEFDVNKYKADEGYRDYVRDDLQRAIAKADKLTSNLFNSAAASEQKLKAQEQNKGLYGRINNFLRSFTFNEARVFWDSANKLVGGKNTSFDSYGEALRVFTLVNSRAIMYSYMSQVAGKMILSLIRGGDDEDELIDKKAAKRAVAQHAQLISMGNRGALFNIAASISFETLHKYIKKAQGEKYNPYKDALLFAPTERGSFASYLSMAGADGDVAKTLYQSGELIGEAAFKYYDEGELTQKDLVDMKAAQYTITLISHLTGTPFDRMGKIAQKGMEAHIEEQKKAEKKSKRGKRPKRPKRPTRD